MIMNYFSNTVSVRWGSPRTIGTHDILERTDRKIRVLYRPESVRNEDFTRNINKHHVKKESLVSYQNRVVYVLPNNYETHLVESGMDLRIIQELLVHKNIKTMEISTHVSHQIKQKISNPLGQLGL